MVVDCRILIPGVAALGLMAALRVSAANAVELPRRRIVMTRRVRKVQQSTSTALVCPTMRAIEEKRRLKAGKK